MPSIYFRGRQSSLACNKVQRRLNRIQTETDTWPDKRAAV